ncbi:ATP-binding protein [Kordiimonas aestuarii]|uniref:ATP-binding protein n=1 Tax=Kordiimonas aestuarii TaxID=1005925 RepID=UPI0021D37818|nr:ATP-binding protein [Kordiimonas aestuarii]
MTGYLIVALIDIAVAFYVLRTSGKNRAALAFALLWVCFGVWSLNLYLASSIADANQLAPWFHLLRFGMFFIAPCMMLFFAYITRARMDRLLKLAIGSSALASTLLYITNLAFFQSTLVPGTTGFTTAADTLSHIHEANFVVAALVSLALTIRALQTAIFREKQRIRWLMAAIVVGTALGITSFEYSKLFGMAGNILGLSILAYALLRHHVINLGFAINSGLTKALALVVLATLFAGLEVAVAQAAFTSTETVLIRMVALFAALESYPWLVARICALRERYFLKPPYHYDFVTHWVLTGLKDCSTPAALRALTDEVFLKLIRVSDYHIDLKAETLGGDTGDGYVRFQGQNPMLYPAPKEGLAFLEQIGDTPGTLFYDEAPASLKRAFAVHRISACVPIMHAGQQIGTITLGTPGKYEQFSYDDIRLMTWFAGEVAPALDRLITTARLESSLNDAEKTLTVVSRLNEYNHDVKTPFSNIEALLLAGDAFSPEEREEKILEQVKKGHALVTTMTRMLKGQHQKVLTRFNLNETIEDVVSSFPTHEGLVQTALNPLPPVDGYEQEISIMLSNLLSNAFKALDKPRSAVNIETWYDKTLDQVGCRIRDNGSGMDAERLATLWQSGETGHRGTGGSGVGTGVVKRIIESHDGSIRATSEPGVGSEFIVMLPAAKRMKPRDAGTSPLRASAG